LVKTYNHFYQAIPVLKETDEPKKALRLALSAATGNVVKVDWIYWEYRFPKKCK
jgi:arginyl-tRNA synthetase